MPGLYGTAERCGGAAAGPPAPAAEARAASGLHEENAISVRSVCVNLVCRL